MSQRLKRLAATVAVGAIAGIYATDASAAPITATVTSVTGEWVSVTGGTSVTGLTTNEVRWGGGTPQSGYRFDGVAPPATDPFNVNDVFKLGDFTHFNNPITAGTSITQATLNVTIDATIENGTTENVSLVSQFIFDHFETPNDDNLCANGESNNSGVNVNGCADIVTPFLNVSASEKVTIDGRDYLFNVTGFDVGAQFETIEQDSNTASLNGSFTAVPVPATFALLGAGLIGLGVLGRRRSAQ